MFGKPNFGREREFDVETAAKLAILADAAKYPETASVLEAARERLGADTGAVEFRHHAWMTGALARRTPALLTDLELAYVVVDGPQGLESSMPPALEVTSSRLAVMRLHGRREMAEHLRRILELSERKANALHIIYNNCHGNYAVTNAAELTWMLLERGADGEVQLEPPTRVRIDRTQRPAVDQGLEHLVGVPEVQG